MDARTTKGYWLLPTKGHAHDRLPTFLKWAIKAGCSTPGLILVERGDFYDNKADYDTLVMPEGWRIVVAEGACTGEVTEWAYRTLVNDCDWIGWLGDDSRPITEGWDVRSIANLNGTNFCSTDDGVFAPQRANGVMVFSGDLVRAVGWFYPPGLKHFFWDDCWEYLGKMTGCWTVDMSILMQHDHDLVTGRLDAMTNVKNSFWPNDIPAFQRLKTDGTLREAAERILMLMRSKGATVIDHDMRGVKLMMATPSNDRRYEGAYVRTKDAVADCVRQLGGEFIWSEMPYSTVDFARSKQLGNFYRSGCTHLWLFDADQAANPNDILRMIGYRKDFVAVAGVRKSHPPSFAVTSQDDAGNPVPISIDSQTGLLSSRHIRVGMACCLLTRHCAERMIQGYPELTYRTADGQDEVGVFMPTIVNRTYLGEDLAFCHRWNAIGGTIHIDGSISLDHIGPYVYQGAWLTHLESMEKARAAAA